MNEEIKCVIKTMVVRNCCSEEAKCELCIPKWQRSALIDEGGAVWFPITGVDNVVLTTISRSEHGLVQDSSTGIWWIDEAMAQELADTTEKKEAIVSLSDRIRDAYDHISSESQLTTVSEAGEPDVESVIAEG